MVRYEILQHFETVLYITKTIYTFVLYFFFFGESFLEMKGISLQRSFGSGCAQFLIISILLNQTHLKKFLTRYIFNCCSFEKIKTKIKTFSACSLPTILLFAKLFSSYSLAGLSLPYYPFFMSIYNQSKSHL